MNTALIYNDSDNNECTINQMVKREPDWAASRIKAGEVAEKKLAAIINWLETNQPDVFSRGLWDAINGV